VGFGGAGCELLWGMVNIWGQMFLNRVVSRFSLVSNCFCLFNIYCFVILLLHAFSYTVQFVIRD